MTGSDPHKVTKILEAIGSGEAQATERLLELVYDELRRLAQGRMAGEARGRTLQPTALVHEAYLLLFEGKTPKFENRAHFFAAAAEAMRRVLVDQARERRTLKRGGDRVRVTLGEGVARYDARPEELLDIDEALRNLEAHDAEMANVVKLRYFAGLTLEETAEALGKSSRTVARSWREARAWLQRELTRGGI